MTASPLQFHWQSIFIIQVVCKFILSFANFISNKFDHFLVYIKDFLIFQNSKDQQLQQLQQQQQHQHQQKA